MDLVRITRNIRSKTYNKLQYNWKYLQIHTMKFYLDLITKKRIEKIYAGTDGVRYNNAFYITKSLCKISLWNEENDKYDRLCHIYHMDE